MTGSDSNLNTEQTTPGSPSQGEEREFQLGRLFDVIYRAIDSDLSFDEVVEIALSWNEHSKTFAEQAVREEVRWCWNRWSIERYGSSQTDKRLSQLGISSEGSAWRKRAELLNCIHDCIKAGIPYDSLVAIVANWNGMEENPTFSNDEALEMFVWAWDMWASKISPHDGPGGAIIRNALKGYLSTHKA